MIELTPALAGQILVTAFLAVIAGIAIVAPFVRLFEWYVGRRADRREAELQLAAELEAETTDRIDELAYGRPDIDDDVHEDVEHMRAAGEHAPTLDHRSIPYRRSAT